jgi:polyisoprenoid-binding protein YceI
MRTFLALLLLSSAALAQAPARNNTYVPDKNHSTVAFEIDILNKMSRVTGKFTTFDAQLSYDPAEPTRSTLNVHIKCESINTGIDARDKDLRTASFFDCEKNPEITFVSKVIKRTSAGLDVTGDFTMHGVTKTITLKVTPTGQIPFGKDTEKDKGTEYGFTGTVSLNREDYGMNWKHNELPSFVGDNVDVRLFFLFKPAPPPKPAAS